MKKRSNVDRLFNPITKADKKVSVSYRDLLKDGRPEALKAIKAFLIELKKLQMIPVN